MMSGVALRLDDETDALRRSVRSVCTAATLIGGVGWARIAAAAAAAADDGCMLMNAVAAACAALGLAVEALKTWVGLRSTASVSARIEDGWQQEM